MEIFGDGRNDKRMKPQNRLLEDKLRGRKRTHQQLVSSGSDGGFV